MRLVVILMTFLLFVGIVGFVLTNLDTKVGVTVWKTEYRDLPLFLVVVAAVFAGICYAGIIGVTEGAHTRFENRRLLREVRRLETELNYVRTQPSSAPRPEPDAVQEPATAPKKDEGTRAVAQESSVATAPVYGGDEEDWGPDDDDPYTGRRAV